MQTFDFGLSRWRNMPGKLQLVPQMTRWYKTPTKILFCLVPGGGVLGLIFNGFVTLPWQIQTFRLGGGGKGWGQSSRPCNKGGLVSKNFFSALQASVWPKNKMGGGRGRGRPLPWIYHCAGLLKPLPHYSLFWVSII